MTVMTPTSSSLPVLHSYVYYLLVTGLILVVLAEDMLHAAYLTIGKLAPDYENVELSVGGSTVAAAVVEATGQYYPSACCACMQGFSFTQCIPLILRVLEAMGSILQLWWWKPQGRPALLLLCLHAEFNCCKMRTSCP